ncbi:bifunctional oligoribonuclease/PAP phosphatase NrnA [candidate division WS5 bacterium]|uniref:Bifunctional oligoribonuclease/PAP phosphatase NrnA n=1 Tax=candidate division WS5 bacterium TaxID=2093353 RepID=A0A419DCS9_9BACT|nr:MAG: bifunctional oligoribonuclease/PAP phosphatase NrnA [candidate division WS5 bacterium]
MKTAEKVNAQSIADALKEAGAVAIFGHVLPDSDCMGSMFGMKFALERAGKKAYAYFDGKVPDNLRFMGDYGNLDVEGSVMPADLVLVFDSSQVNRVGQEGVLRDYKKEGTPIYQVDHHMPGDLSGFADCSWQDDKKSSTSEMALEILKEMGFLIKKDTATALLAGIEGDTGSFQHQNTTQDSLEAAAYLISKGARFKAVVDNTLNFKRDLNLLKLHGLVLERIVYNKKYKTATSYLTLDDEKRFGVEGESYSGIANLLNVVDGAKAVILISEREGGMLKVSLRTRDEHVDVQKLASYVGGGGHVKASGFSIKGKIEIQDGQVRVV